MTRSKKINEEAKDLKQSYEPKIEEIKVNSESAVYDGESQKLEYEYIHYFNETGEDTNEVLEDTKKEEYEDTKKEKYREKAALLKSKYEEFLEILDEVYEANKKGDNVGCGCVDDIAYIYATYEMDLYKAKDKILYLSMWNR